MNTYYNVFVRNFWKIENGVRKPDPSARKTYLAERITEEDARQICKEFNESHNPGIKSRKAEYQDVFEEAILNHCK